MKSFRRIIAAVLSFVMVLLMMPHISFEVTAQTTSLYDLQSRYPDGKYWNHYVSSVANCGDQLGARNDESYGGSVTSTPCASHSATSAEYYVGKYDCNYFDGAWQCQGFARRLGFEAFGTKVTTWSKHNSVANIKPGDVIQFWSPDTDPTWGHGVFVTAVSGSIITVAEANLYGDPCRIRWGHQYNLGTAYKVEVYSAPGTLDTGSSVPQVEYASIASGDYYLRNNSTGKYLAVDGGIDAEQQNISVADFTGGSEMKLAISAAARGYIMRPHCATRIVNPYGTTVSAGLNVSLFPDVSDATQWWGFEKVSGGYIIRNIQNQNCVLSVDGTNVVTANYTGAAEQIWSLETNAGFTVTYDANGGIGAPEQQVKGYNQSLTIPSTTPTREGHTFVGWGASSTATAASYYAGSSYTANMSITLYAIWRVHTYTVSYNSNGGSGSPSPQVKTYGKNLILDTTAPRRTGYSFLGWATSSTATSASYQPGSTYTANADMTLYAVWKANSYTVSYNANGGTGAPIAQTKTYGQSLTLSSVIPTREGYIFLGWATNATATSIVYESGDTYSGNSDVVLHAVWKEFWEFDESTGTLIISGIGNMPDYSTTTTGRTQPWASIVDQIKVIIVGEQITNISTNAFHNCSNVTMVEILGNITSIGAGAFYGCGSLTDITLPSSLTGIGNNAFYSCSSLESILIPDSVTQMGQSVFYNCTRLKKAVIPGNLSKLEMQSFCYCTSLSEVIINDGLTEIEWNAFYDCDNLQSVVIPASVKSICDSAFASCDVLKDVYISDVAAWCAVAFETEDANPLYNGAALYVNGEKVSRLEIPEGVTVIGDYAFVRCSALEDITVPASVTSIGNSAFRESGLIWVDNENNNYFSDQYGVLYNKGKTMLICGNISGRYIIDSNVKIIDSYAFYNSSITDITLPAGITEISEYAFKIGSLKTISYAGTLEQWNEISVEEGNDDLLANVIFTGNGNGVTSGTCGNGVSWEFNMETGVMVVSGSGSMADAVNPWGSYINAKITSLLIEEGITVIGGGAFSTCTALKEVSLPSTLTRIGSSAFCDCTNLEAIVIPDNVTAIGVDAFARCTKLADIILSNSLTELSVGVVQQCTSLTSIFIPASIVNINYNSFYGCTSLSQVQIDKNNQVYAVDGQGVLFSKDGKTLISAIAMIKGEYNIPNGTVTVSDSAFNSNTLSEVYIPGSVTSIGSGAFTSCVNLESVHMSEGLTSIGDSAFYKCYRLTEIYIPDGVTSLENYVFAGCQNLANIFIPSSVVSIGVSAFSGCLNLTEVTIPDNVTSIGRYAFSGCSNLTQVNLPDALRVLDDGVFQDCLVLTDVKLPENLEEIQQATFNNCKSLKSITIPSKVNSIGQGVFESCQNLTQIQVSTNNIDYSSDEYGVLFNKDMSVLICAPAGIGRSYTIPSTVTMVNDYAFASCENLESVYIPEGVISIGTYAFKCCEALGNICIPESVSKIATGLLYGCTNLKNIILPKSITSIEQYAFQNCSSLEKMSLPTNVASISTSVFDGCISLMDITLPEGVTSIGRFAFENCISLENVIIPTTVSYIDDFAFKGCTALAQINFPSGLTYIGTYAFQNCTSLTEIYIPAGVTSIGPFTFQNCTNLIEIYIPAGVTRIASCAFDNCTSLTEIHIPASVISIESCAFRNCTNLTEMYIPASVTNIGSGFVAGCSSLTNLNVDVDNQYYCSDSHSVLYDISMKLLINAPGTLGGTYTIPDSVTTIDNRAFSGCKGLKTLIIPNSVVKIGQYAFQDCSSIEVVYYGGSSKQWKSVDISESENDFLLNSTRVYLGNFAYSIENNQVTITDYTDITTELIVPSTFENHPVVAIGSNAFEDDVRLVKVAIPVTVIEIGRNAFAGCTALKSVSYAGSRAQWDEVSVEDGNEMLTSASIEYGINFLALSSNAETLDINQELKLSASLDFGKTALMWTSSNPSVALVVDGVVTAMSAGTAVITAQAIYNGEMYSDSCTITVREPVLTGISTNTQPDKTEYERGDDLDITGMEIIAHYSDGHTKTITDGFTISGFDSTITGTKTVTVTYHGFTSNFDVTIKVPTATGIVVTSLPDKTEYEIGEILDIAGLSITGVYSDGSTAEITEGYELGGFDSAFSGTKTVTVTYEGFVATFDVTIKEPVLTGISISNGPVQTVYELGSLLDTEGLDLTLTYSDGSTKVVTEGFTVEGFDSETVGEKILTITYEDFVDTFTVTVKEPTLLDVVITKLPDKTEYESGEALDTTGLTLKATYSNGYSKEITEGFDVSGLDSTAAGTKSVTVTYGGKTTTFTVTVNEPIIDENAPQIVVGAVRNVAGSKVAVAICLKNNPGIASAMLQVDYDTTTLTLLEVQDKGLLGSATHMPELVSPYILRWSNNAVTQDFTSNGAIVVLVFEIAEDAQEGDYPVTVSYDYNNYDIINWQTNKVNFSITNGAVKVGQVLPTELDQFAYSFSGTGMTIDGYVGEDTEVVIGSTYVVAGMEYAVTAIAESAFKENAVIESIVIPGIVQTIGDCAFADCESIVSVTYCGSEDHWNSIAIGTGNQYLTNATRFYHNVTGATCARPGICTICGATGETLPHSGGVWFEILVPTCSEEGMHARICDVCGETEIAALPALGHSYNTVVTAPTCTEQGYTNKTCSVCGATEITDYVPAKGHKWSAWIQTKAPTCTTEGSKTRFCNCATKETVAIPTIDHTYGNGACTVCGILESNCWVLTGDVQTNLSVKKDSYIDLNGYTITGNITIADGATLYVFDSATADYTAANRGKIIGTITGNLARSFNTPETYGHNYKYLTLEEEPGVWSFHRYYLTVKSVILRPCMKGEGYTGTAVDYRTQFKCNELVAQYVTAYGTKLVGDNTVYADYMAQGYTLNAGAGNTNEQRTWLTGVFKTTNTAEQNAANALVAPTVSAYITLADGTEITSAGVQRSLQDMIVYANGLTNLTTAEKKALGKMYDHFKDVLDTWSEVDISYIKSYAL